jgi:UDP-N-acetylmuramate--alanine ligase
MFRNTQRIHFVGIGGIGMSGIAEILLSMGYEVSGSDLVERDTVKRLEELGAEFYLGHHGENLHRADVVVVSSAVSQDNPEVKAARERAIPVIPRAEMLAELMRMKHGVAIAGSHGKTTTTSMVATVLTEGGHDPTVIIGGKLNQLGSNARLGNGKLLVAEADESDGSFLKLTPTVAVVTSLDEEHLDHYGSLEQIRGAFLNFINKVPFYGLAVLCADQERIMGLLPQVEKRYVTYGLEGSWNYTAHEISFDGMRTGFQLHHQGRKLGEVVINMPGVHNVYNALAAAAVGLEFGMDFRAVRKALNEFEGVQRRFQVKGLLGETIVVDDYGHHPTEIRATLQAARNGWPDRKLIVVFQPHRYTRTRDLLREFCRCFDEAHTLILTDIYPAGEEPIPGVTAERIKAGIEKEGGCNLVFSPDKGEIPSLLQGMDMGRSILITLGAGDIWQVGEDLLSGVS